MPHDRGLVDPSHMCASPHGNTVPSSLPQRSVMWCMHTPSHPQCGDKAVTTSAFAVGCSCGPILCAWGRQCGGCHAATATTAVHVAAAGVAGWVGAAHPTDPNNASAYNNLGCLLENIRKDYDGAEQNYRAALRAGSSVGSQTVVQSIAATPH